MRSLKRKDGKYMLAFLLAEQVTEVTLNTQHRLFQLFIQSDIFIQLTCVILFFFSVVSWAIIGMKIRQLKKDKRRSEKFLNSFWKSKSIDSLLQTGSFMKSPSFHIFKSGIAALKEHGDEKNKERIEYAIRRSTENEVENLESYVPFLATTSSAAPFLGLFGTVWGILNAFWKLGQSANGGGSMEMIGPHIAEALAATALGLITAIPAVIFYNYFVGRIRLLTRDLNQFAGDLMNRIEDEYLK